MSTSRDLISRVRSTHKMLSGDNSMSDRAIFAEVRAVNLTLLKRETDKRRLWATDSAFHTVKCLRLEEVSLSECCDAPAGVMVSRSKQRLPKIADGNLGHLVQGVYTVQGHKKIDETNLNRYINSLKLKLKRKGVEFFIFDQYLYTTNPDLKAVMLRAHFEEDIPLELLYPRDCDVCGRPNPPCTNPLDEEFRTAGYLEGPLIQMVSQQLLGTYFRTNEDKSTDHKDDQVSKT